MSSVLIRSKHGYDADNMRQVLIEMLWDKSYGYYVRVSTPPTMARDNGTWFDFYKSQPYHGRRDKLLKNCYSRQVTKYPMNEAQRLALAYGTLLHSWLTPEEMKSLETNPDDSPGNYCDDNMAMATAFIVVTGRHYTFFNEDIPESEKQYEVDTSLWNEAYNYAVSWRYEAEEKPIKVSVDGGEPITIYQYIDRLTDDCRLDFEDAVDLDLIKAIRNTPVGADVAEATGLVRTA